MFDEADLRAALASFEPVWDQLFPKEKARILHLLIEKVEYHAKDGRVEIEFRAGGMRVLGKNTGKNEADDAKGR